MILGEASPDELALARNAGRVTLDDLIGRAIGRSGDGIALSDGPGRARLCDGAPLTLTYRRVDRIVTAIAARLRQAGLGTDAVVALHLPNTAEAMLTLLGVLRAGMIAAPMPLLWGRTEMVQALARVGARAIVTCRRVGAIDLSDLAMEAAAETFTIRAVFGFGHELPDGIVPLDPLLELEAAADREAFTTTERAVNPAAHVAVVTFETGPNGPIPVARSHVELLAAGVAVVLECRLEPGAALVSTLQPSSLAGLATGLVASLLVASPLGLHVPFCPDEFAVHMVQLGARAAVVPGPLADRLRDAGIFRRAARLADVLSVWRAPERLAASPDWTEGGPRLVDVQVFGETGLIAARRPASGRPAAIGIGAVTAPRSSPGAALVAEIIRTEQGMLAMRGPMVPRFAFPPGAERRHSGCLEVQADFRIDTRHACRIDKETGNVTISAPPPGDVGIGGYRIPLVRLDERIEETAAGATVLAVPDALLGRRLVGDAPDCRAARRDLAAAGFGPLVASAFSERRMLATAAA